jgi:hypothetical protein
MMADVPVTRTTFNWLIIGGPDSVVKVRLADFETWPLAPVDNAA